MNHSHKLVLQISIRSGLGRLAVQRQSRQVGFLEEVSQLVY